MIAGYCYGDSQCTEVIHWACAGGSFGGGQVNGIEVYMVTVVVYCGTIMAPLARGSTAAAVHWACAGGSFGGGQVGGVEVYTFAVVV